jgi:hypothetical protein
VTRNSAGLASNAIEYKIGESLLEARIPLGALGNRIPKGAVRTLFKIANLDASGAWKQEVHTDNLFIDYYE